MKKSLLTIVLLLSVMVSVFAQAPQKFSYQAVVRDAGNNLVAARSVGVQISILQGTATGAAVYVETQNVTTNANGLMTLEIGAGTAVSGDFSTIDWADGPYFLKTETDPDGGTNYTIEGTQQLLSVPYALYAGNAANGFSGSYNDLTDQPTIPTVPTNVSAFTNDAGYITSADIPAYQVLSISNDTIYLTNGGYVVLPAGFSGNYNDLTNQPTIPTVPTNVSAFTNDAGYITMDSVPEIPSVPTNVSAFENDAHYITDIQLQQILNTITDMQNSIDSLNQVIENLDSQVSQLQPTLGTVVTGAVGDITSTSATAGGQVTANGHDEIVARGVCWGTNNPPTIADSHTTDGVGLGEFVSTVSGLTPNTTYYLCAYVTNVQGTAYGEVVTFTTLCNNVTVTISGSTDIALGQSTTLTAAGASTYVWNTGDTLAAITVAPTDETTYSVVGTNQYGCTSTASATVNVSQPGGQPCPGAATITDADGNTYGTVQIGEQCWMKENLRTTRYSDNTPIAQGSDTSSTVGFWYYPSNNSANATTLGLLYNWAALMRGAVSSDENPSDVQGICPAGWHVPSDAEWTELTDFVGSQSDYTCGGYSGNIAKALASKTGWMNFSSNCTVGNNSADNDATGFGMVPAGYYSGSFNASTTAYCASATEYSENYVYNRNIGFFSPTVTRGNFSKFTAVSVRCLRNIAEEATDPCAPTSSTHNIEITTAELPYAFGDTTFLAGTATGTYVLVRANAAGCDSTITINLTVNEPAEDFICGTSTITDADNNTYNTVQIGEQCWMKENLRTTKKPNGTTISSGIWAPGSNSVTTYGRLYSWTTVMNGATSSNATPSGVQGICPTGWHVPSDNEWKQMEMAVGMSQNGADDDGE